MEWAPSQVRQAILEAHAMLRGKLDEMEALMARVGQGEAAAEPTLTAVVLDFQASFLSHIVQEEAVLRPVLHKIDAWGDVRVDRMDAEHQEQRKMLEELRVMVTSRRAAECGPRLRTFVDEVRADMAAEERDALPEDLLKDDPISTGPSD